MYAIKNKKTGKWVYGTDRSSWPYHQMMSQDEALLFSDWYCEFVSCGKTCMDIEIKTRGIDMNEYELVKVHLTAEQPNPIKVGENGNPYCPNCKNKIGVFRGRKYCPDCGQRVLWECEMEVEG